MCNLTIHSRVLVSILTEMPRKIWSLIPCLYVSLRGYFNINLQHLKWWKWELRLKSAASTLDFCCCLSCLGCWNEYTESRFKINRPSPTPLKKSDKNLPVMGDTLENTAHGTDKTGRTEKAVADQQHERWCPDTPALASRRRHIFRLRTGALPTAGTPVSPHPVFNPPPQPPTVHARQVYYFTGPWGFGGISFQKKKTGNIIICFF